MKSGSSAWSGCFGISGALCEPSPSAEVSRYPGPDPGADFDVLVLAGAAWHLRVGPVREPGHDRCHSVRRSSASSSSRPRARSSWPAGGPRPGSVRPRLARVFFSALTRVQVGLDAAALLVRSASGRRRLSADRCRAGGSPGVSGRDWRGSRVRAWWCPIFDDDGTATWM